MSWRIEKGSWSNSVARPKSSGASEQIKQSFAAVNLALEVSFERLVWVRNFALTQEKLKALRQALRGYLQRKWLALVLRGRTRHDVLFPRDSAASFGVIDEEQELVLVRFAEVAR